MFALKDDIACRAIACAAEVSWRQWRSLGSTGLSIGSRAVASIIDPEALVLLSLTVRQHERRLDDQLLWWANLGAPLMSVQRMRTLLGDFPESTQQELAWFAALAIEAGDRRWRVFADGLEGGATGRLGKGPKELMFLEPSTLMLRLRAGFGVGAKADLLTFLLGSAGTLNEHATWATAEVIAKATSYSVASIRRAAGEMVLARLVSASADRPIHYSVDAGEWARLLDLHRPRNGQDNLAKDALSDVPPWRFWSQMFSFLAACVELGDSRLVKAAPVVQASHLRDLVERFRRPLAWNEIEWIDPRAFPGERYLEAFGLTFESVATRVMEMT